MLGRAFLTPTIGNVIGVQMKVTSRASTQSLGVARRGPGEPYPMLRQTLHSPELIGLGSERNFNVYYVTLLEESGVVDS